MTYSAKREFLTHEEVLELLRISRTTLYRYRLNDGFPSPYLFGQQLRFDAAEVDVWIDGRKEVGDE